MSDLDQKEQDHVRAALRLFQRRLGTLAAVASALKFSTETIKKVLGGRDAVSASMAIRVARLAGVMVDDLLVGKFLPPGACPNCGHIITSDFKDENTIAEEAQRLATAGLSLAT